MFTYITMMIIAVAMLIVIEIMTMKMMMGTMMMMMRMNVYISVYGGDSCCTKYDCCNCDCTDVAMMIIIVIAQTIIIAVIKAI